MTQRTNNRLDEIRNKRKALARQIRHKLFADGIYYYIKRGWHV